MMRRSAQLAVAVCLFGLGLGVWLVQRKASNSSVRYLPRPKGTLTFNKDIAPIIFKQCSGCHRPGQSAPFSLLTYADAKKRSQEIAEVTAKRIMPPWLPEPGYGEFAEARILSAEELGQVGQWISEGAIEGEGPAPPLPKWSEGWQLGEPDLAVKMAEPYTLAAEGQDVYRNFVIGVPVSETRYVRAIEFQPGNPKIVHHAFMRFDRTSQSRQKDEQDPLPGFDGLHSPRTALAPDGHFLSWQPGKVPSRGVEKLAWRLDKGTDLVLQVHMQPSGKPETLQSAVGFHFAEKPAASSLFKIGLSSYAIDIPPGQKDYVIEDSYVLPIDVEVLAALPHAHYLGKELRGYATLPDGTKKWLLLIKQWNFDWQGDYRYANPVALPKGATITMQFIYDNSADNPRNPNQPPKRVQYGLQSTDEMGELWFQLQLHHPKDEETLSQNYQYKVARDVIAYNEYLLRLNPDDTRARNELAKGFLTLGRQADAVRQLQIAAQQDATYAEPHYFLGILYRQQKKLTEARVSFETAVRLDPANFKAHGNLGLIYLERGDIDRAETHFREALRLNLDDDVARESLNDIATARRQIGRGNK